MCFPRVKRQMSHLSAISSHILWIMAASMVATASVIRARGSSKLAGRGGIKTLSLTYTRTEMSRGVKSGDRGGQAIFPPRPIQATTVRGRYEVTSRWKCRGAPYFCKMKSLSICCCSWRAEAIFVDCERTYAAHFLSSHLQHKVDPVWLPVRYTASFNKPIGQRWNSNSLKWFFCDTWSWIFSERKWAVAIRETTYDILRALHRYTTPWSQINTSVHDDRQDC
jgi:hypothetical protein